VRARAIRRVCLVAVLAVLQSRCESTPSSVGVPGPGAESVNAIVAGTQQGLAGWAVNARPGVRLTDAMGLPVSGRSVAFTVASGGGSVTPASATTSANGVVQVSSWTLGTTPGINTLTVTVAGNGIMANPVTFTATGQAPAFNITLQNVGPSFTAPVQAAFDSATAKWQRIIYQDIADIPNFSSPADQCFTGQPAIGPITVDDVLILATVDSIDGPGTVLGTAGPCFLRLTGRLPIMGLMVFDSADIADLIAADELNEVILHEMGHVLGIGTLWNQGASSCLQLPSTPPGMVLDTYFSCQNARAAFDSLGGTHYTGGNKVPVENCGPSSPAGCGGGTVNGHWREPTFANELMTGYLNGETVNPLSILTAAAMEDLGYGVNYAAADPYTRTFSLVAAASRPAVRSLGDDVRHGPIYVVAATGQIVQVLPPR
jgi:hypothetical protein